jgi:hypothetical protein
MEFSEEFNRIFNGCEDKNYINLNVPYIAAFFENPDNLNMLRHSLTTKRNFTALKIIEKLGLKTAPYMIINQHTYLSVYWLYKMGIIPSSDFKKMKTQFEIMKKAQAMFEDTEKIFINMQIEHKREAAKSNKTVERSMSIRDLGFKICTDLVVFVNVDSIFNVKQVAEANRGLVESIFNVHEVLDTLHIFDSDLQHYTKASTLAEIRKKLCMKIAPKNMILDKAQRKQIESLESHLLKLKRMNILYFIVTESSLGDLLVFLYLYFHSVDISCAAKIHLSANYPTSQRILVFDRSNLPLEFLPKTVENLIENRRKSDRK